MDYSRKIGQYYCRLLKQEGRGGDCCSFGKQDKFLLVMALIQADFPMCALLMCISMTVKEKSFLHTKRQRGKVKVLPAVIFHLIPLFPTSLCKAWLDKPVINMPVFAYVNAYMHNLYIDPQRLC